MRLFLLMLFLTGLLQNAMAYPIPPRPLRALVAESQYILVGYVVKTFDKETGKKKKRKSHFSENRIARIAVLELLKGQLNADTIELEFNPYMFCPAPAMYYDSTQVICFLNRDDNKNLYTQALSYGSKTLNPEEIAVYKARIAEIQNIAHIENASQKLTETTEWLVKCAENPATRWEGVFELKPGSNFMSFYSHDAGIAFDSLLTGEQKERLFQALLSTPEINYYEFALVDLAYKGHESQIDAMLLKSLKALSTENYWLADEYFSRLRYRNLSADMRNLMDRFSEIKFDSQKTEEFKAIINDFIALVDKP